ncbi:hypothetical protein [Aminicella lysinilytica]|uniref:Uncharacterized protein n=1 Tax=Aminicella lysinilytica TaxID=433323 RepID=A0A4R6PZ08_9FIRM|nr:hypothetical protein [Aminicella lysinilytica]TDP48637.1 hypothetical protein EV211_1493 [Aminicella lysinilytica]
MIYILMIIPPLAAIAALVAAVKKGFNKEAMIVAAVITMAINMFAIHKVTMYGLLCTVTIPLALAYVLICLALSIKENKEQ